MFAAPTGNFPLHRAGADPDEPSECRADRDISVRLAFTGMDPITLVVENTFHIRGRGVIVYPTVGLDRAKPGRPALLFSSGVRLTVDLTYPDGEARQVGGNLVNEFLILLDGGRRTDVLVVLDESIGQVPKGTILKARIADDPTPPSRN
jgi:hypothetical protein